MEKAAGNQFPAAFKPQLFDYERRVSSIPIKREA
jgi:hypothetical protein